jgi:hypothetical protein
MTLEQFRATHATRAPLAGENFIGHWYGSRGYIAEVGAEFRAVPSRGPAVVFSTLADAESFLYDHYIVQGRWI